MNELEHIQANLESPNYLNTIIKTCNLDLRQVIDNFKKEVLDLDKTQNLYSIDVNIDVNLRLKSMIGLEE